MQKGFVVIYKSIDLTEADSIFLDYDSAVKRLDEIEQRNKKNKLNYRRLSEDVIYYSATSCYFISEAEIISK